MMRFVDEKFVKNKAHYILQCLLATGSVFIILLILDAATNTAAVAAIGATAFITFTMPKARVSQARFAIGGYVIGVLSGVLSYHASKLPFVADIAMMSYLSAAVFGAIAVGLTIFIMVIINLEHPPAAGVALGLVLNNCQPRTIFVVLVGVVALTLVKRLLRPLLINLL